MADLRVHDPDPGVHHPPIWVFTMVRNAHTGCTSPMDPTEERDCEDGIDNDGDGTVDLGQDSYVGDPGCNLIQMDSESPQCSDEADNDGDGQTDFPADSLCLGAWDDDEAGNDPPVVCGLVGIEPLALMGWALARRGRRLRRKLG